MESYGVKPKQLVVYEEKKLLRERTIICCAVIFDKALQYVFGTLEICRGPKPGKVILGEKAEEGVMKNKQDQSRQEYQGGGLFTPYCYHLLHPLLSGNDNGHNIKFNRVDSTAAIYFLMP
jgi:hypothetical protein